MKTVYEMFLEEENDRLRKRLEFSERYNKPSFVPPYWEPSEIELSIPYHEVRFSVMAKAEAVIDHGLHVLAWSKTTDEKRYEVNYCLNAPSLVVDKLEAMRNIDLCLQTLHKKMFEDFRKELEKKRRVI